MDIKIILNIPKIIQKEQELIPRDSPSEVKPFPRPHADFPNIIHIATTNPLNTVGNSSPAYA